VESKDNERKIYKRKTYHLAHKIIILAHTKEIDIAVLSKFPGSKTCSNNLNDSV